MRLGAIWRYPVKSLQGEQRTESTIDTGGLSGDRCWGIRDEVTGKILTGRREPRLLLAAASLDEAGAPAITLPSGDRFVGANAETDAALSVWLERPVTLVSSVGAPGGDAEFFADATDDSSEVIGWTMPAGRFVDALPLLVLTTASIRSGAGLHPTGDWNVRRFRPNLLIDVDDDGDGDGWVEDGWCGRTVSVGGVALLPRAGCTRCTMVTRPQPGLDRDLDVYRTLAQHHGSTLGVWSDVASPGTIRVGDQVVVSA